MDLPEDLKYTEAHEWVRLGNSRTVRIGITAVHTERLAEVVSVDLPSVGDEVAEGDIVGELDSDQGLVEMHSPVDGVVSEVNDEALDRTDLILEDPYGDGWLFEVDLDEDAELDDLLDLENYLPLAES